MILKENELDLDTYLKLRQEVGWKKLSNEQAQCAINNSLITVVAYDNHKPVGMGRSCYLLYSGFNSYSFIPEKRCRKNDYRQTG